MNQADEQVARDDKDLATIIVDSRESRSDVPAWLKRLGYKTETAELDVGDYQVSGLVLCERKAASDFIASLETGRLFNQAEQLANHDDRAVMILEGNLSSVRSQLDAESIAGALAALAMYYGLHIIPTEGSEQTARVIGRLLRHRAVGLGYDIPTRVAKPKIDGALSEYLVCGLPTVGPQTARRMLGHFGSAAAVFAASKTELQAVKGVGTKMADAMFNAVHHRPTAFRDTKGPAPGKQAG